MTPVRYRRGGVSLRRPAKPFAVESLAGCAVETSHHTIVGAAVKPVADSDGRLHVVALARMHPRNAGVGVGGLGRCDVAGRIGSDGAHGSQIAVSAGEVNQSVGEDGR